ncbi:MAG: hypothetical protein M1836_001191 [Candelina mexicana]|nr:MAG: hypothetical protein M1836_001191 [Candelina mexicana]
MPARVTSKAPPPALSSESSSLSSAPDILEVEAEVTTKSPVVDKAVEDVSRDLLDESNSRPSKRRRTEPAAEVSAPTKRVKRSSNAARQTVKEEAETIGATEFTQDTRKKVAKVRASKINSVKAEPVEAVAEVIEDPIPAASKVIPRRAKAAAKVIKQDEETNPEESKKVRKKRKTEEDEAAIDKELDVEEPQKEKRKKKIKEEDEEAVIPGEPKKVKKKRKTKEEKELEAMPIAARSTGLKMFIGAHVSAAKGVHNAVTNCVHIGGNAFALFLKSQRKWENPPLQDEHTAHFKSHCDEHKFDAASHVLPHGSYLVNLAQKDADKAKQAYDAFVDDLHRCEKLGIKLYNFQAIYQYPHDAGYFEKKWCILRNLSSTSLTSVSPFSPGNTGPSPRPEAIARIADRLNAAHHSTSTVKTVLENMAGTGNVIGSSFEDLRDIIALVKDRSRAAGYDLRTPESFKSVMESFDNIIGMKNLSALHINDSKAPFASHRDLHQNIGLGFLGLRAFHNVMNEPRFHGLPMVLETPISVKTVDDTGKEKETEDKAIWAREIKMLESFIGMDADSEEFLNLEKELADKGVEERKKYQDQYERKLEKDRAKAEKGKKKKKKGKQEANEDDGEVESNSSLSSDGEEI